MNEHVVFKGGPVRFMSLNNVIKDLALVGIGKMDFRSLIDTYKPHRDHVVVEVRNKDGRLRCRRVSHNLRTNVGGSVIAMVMGKAQYPPANYVGLSTNSAAASTADTALTGELNASGLVRTLAAFTNNPPGVNSTVSQQASFQLSLTWTYSGSTTQTINKVACFDNAVAGNMWWEAVITAAAVAANGDQISLVWTFNF